MTAKIEWIHIDEILSTWGSEDDSMVNRHNPNKTIMESILDLKRRDDGYNKLKKSLRLYGLKKPLSYTIVDGKRMHFNGHHRLAALIDLGFTMIPYVKSRSYNTITDEQWTKLAKRNPNLVHEVPKSKSLLAL